MNSSKEKTIIHIIELAKKKIEFIEDLSNIDTGTKFESYVVSIIREIAKDYNISVKQTGPQSFPDIIIGGTYGIEVKFTKSDKWESMGNSIFEGTLKKEARDQIFIFFGRKVGKRIEVIYRNYEDCLADIKVTHSPRFYLNMKIDKGKSIFQKIGVRYEEFKKMLPKEKSILLKEYVRSTLNDGEFLWWLDDEKSIAPKVKEYRKLPRHKKQYILLESMVLFPEVFSSNSMKYLGLSVYLLEEYQIISSSLRDIFSASGKRKIIVNGTSYNVPQIYSKLYNNANKILEIINNIDIDKLKQSWSRHGDMSHLQEDIKVEVWKSLLNNLAKGLPDGLKASTIFDESIKNKNVKL
jgi:hypothetical protein